MRILIAGASGAIGRPLVRRLKANQHEIFALTRAPDPARLKEIGAEPLIADALDSVAVKAAVGRIRPDTVINELTSLPRHYAPAEMKAAAERDQVGAFAFVLTISRGLPSPPPRHERFHSRAESRNTFVKGAGCRSDAQRDGQRKHLLPEAAKRRSALSRTLKNSLASRLAL